MKRYDVCLSFAGEDRDYVERVALELRRRKVSVFYDSFEEANLWGKNLYTYLADVYENQARFCVMFISRHYVEKRFPRHERDSAQARAFVESAEYILPARFDDSDVPALWKTIAYIDLTKVGPEGLADRICQKLGSSLLEGSLGNAESGLSWIADERPSLQGLHASALSFQSIPISFDHSFARITLTRALTRIVSEVQTEDGLAFWTYKSDRKFDRIYVTTSVLYALCQLGVAHDIPIVRSAIDYLKKVTNPSVDDRAGSIFLTLVGELSSESLSAFLENLSRAQLTPENNRRSAGSFLLEQGPLPEGETPNHSSHHRDGASFHACHIADALLHIPEDLAQCRRQAEPILYGIRDFLIRSFIENDGWLVDQKGGVSLVTLYGYALCPALHIPMPAAWRQVSKECNRLSANAAESVFKRFLGIMNSVYAGHSLNDDEFSGEVTRYIIEQFAVFPREGELERLPVLDLSLALRSLVYGVDWLDRRFLPPLNVAATETLREWPGGI